MILIRISIEGSTDIAFTENVQKRMEAFGFQLITVEDGNDLDAIGAAIEDGKADTTRPSFITVKTQIGYGCPGKTWVGKRSWRASGRGKCGCHERVLTVAFQRAILCTGRGV